MNLTLIVMAAGIGSRFGGLKQITPIDEDNNFIVDYSIYDALKAGFKKVVFVIREEFLHDFQSTIGKRLEGKIEVCYAFQKIDEIPIKINLINRTKPWGTVQAILTAKPYVDGSFVVINADDFYGRNAFLRASDFLRNIKNPFTYANISYELGATKSLEGAVKRGILFLNKDRITSMVESSVEDVDGKFIATPLNDVEPFEIEENHPVSMNFFAFQYDVFSLLEEFWIYYFKQDIVKVLQGEVLLPDCLKENLENGRITIVNEPSRSVWLGMTYRSDLEFVKKSIKALKNQGEYNSHLWGVENGEK